MFSSMKKLPKRFLGVLLIVFASITCLVFYFNYIQKQKMYEKFSSHLPDGYFDPKDPTFWKIAINISEQEIEKMESPNYKKQEQDKMKRIGFDITVTDEMISDRYMQTKKELDFAKKELKKLSDSRKNQ